MPLIGHFEVHKAGHSLHNRFLRELFNRPGSYGIFRAAVTQVPFFPHAPMPAPAFPESFQPVGHSL
jgi:UDP-3-O-[3-hydroxymyristoyl] N-acetylglucosamine deacetylase